jgi:hypothetical protein
MIACFDFLFYCFYCLSSRQRPDRVEGAKFILFVCLTLLPLGYYLVLSLMAGGLLFSIRTALCAELLLLAGLWWGYFRPQHYLQRLGRAPSPEPHRVRYALLGVGVIALALLPLLSIPILSGALNERVGDENKSSKPIVQVFTLTVEKSNERLGRSLSEVQHAVYDGIASQEKEGAPGKAFSWAVAVWK